MLPKTQQKQFEVQRNRDSLAAARFLPGLATLSRENAASSFPFHTQSGGPLLAQLVAHFGAGNGARTALRPSEILKWPTKC